MTPEQLEVLPESVREWDEAKNSDTPEIFWDRISNIRSKLGTGLYKPGEDAGDEDWGKFSERAIELSEGRLMPRPDLDDAEQRAALNKVLGVPDEATEYEFEEIEGSVVDDERKAFLGKAALEAGLTKSQLKILDKILRTAEVNTNNDYVEALNSELKSLKQEWGLTFDERTHLAKKVASTFFPHLSSDASFTADELRAFYSLGKQLGENTTEFQKQGQQPSQGLTPDDAAIKIGEIRNNPDHPYNKPQDPGHAAAKKRMRELYLIKNNLPPE